MNTTSTMTPSEMLDEITLRLNQIGGTAFMVCLGASHEITDIPDAFVLEAGYSLQREIQAVHDIALEVSRMIPVNYAPPAAAAPAETQPPSAASVSADLVANLNRLPARQRDAVIGVMQSIVDCEQPSDEDAATASHDTSDEREQNEHNRSNQFDAANILDTLHRVNCGMAMLGRIDDSEDFCEDSDMGKFFLLNTMRNALNAAADRIQADRKQEAAE